MSRRPAGRRGPSAGDDRTGRVSDRFRVRRCRAGLAGSLWLAAAPGARAPVTVPVTPLSPPGRTAGESEPVFIFAQSRQRPRSSPRQSARRHACQLSDWKARGRDACGRDWGSWRRTVSCRMLGVQGSKRDVLAGNRGIGWRLARFDGHVCLDRLIFCSSRL